MDTMISVVVPCYNEEQALPYLYDRLTAVLRQIPCEYEIILVDDGSTDRTAEITLVFFDISDSWFTLWD